MISDTLSSDTRNLLKLAGNATYQSLSSSGEGDPAASAQLKTLTPQNLLVRPARDISSAQCTIAALWMYFDFLQQPHDIVQQVHSDMGSYWHGIIHRRERDYSNAKYWFHRAGGASVDKTLAVRADDLLRTLPADKSLFRLTANGWDPSAFVDLVASVIDQPADPRTALVVSLQRLEWQVLFEHGVRTAGE